MEQSSVEEPCVSSKHANAHTTSGFAAQPANRPEGRDKNSGATPGAERCPRSVLSGQELLKLGRTPRRRRNRVVEVVQADNHEDARSRDNGASKESNTGRQWRP